MRPCSLCGGESLDALWTGRDTDHLLERTFTLYRCRSCGLGQVDPLPTPDEEARLYPTRFYRTSAVPVRRGFLSRAVSAYETFGYRFRLSHVGAPSGGRRLLDVGCGAGRFLAEAHQAGWTVEGVEPSESGARLAREQHGLTVHGGRLDRLGLPAGSYAAITFWHSLEHVADFRAVTAEAVRLLEPGGRLVIAVPNFGGVEARVFLANWGLFDVPRHVVFFTPATLSRLVEEQGLEVRSISHVSPEFDPPIALQNVLNLVCTERMFLYNVAKRDYRPADSLRPEDWRYNMLASLAGAAALGPPALLAAGVFALARSGTTITVVARKSAPAA